MKLTLVIEYQVDSHDDGRTVVNSVMPMVYNARTASTPEAWTWDVSEDEEDED